MSEGRKDFSLNSLRAHGERVHGSKSLGRGGMNRNKPLPEASPGVGSALYVPAASGHANDANCS